MTYAPATLTALARYWTQHGGVNLGVVGDTRHKAKGRSYHLGASALTSDAYSRKTARDRAGLSNAASAIDLGKLRPTAKQPYGELRRFSGWLVERCRDAAPGTLDIREIIFTRDGKTVLRWDRERGLRSTPKPGEADSSHLAHTHISFYRDSEKRPKTAAFSPYFTSGPMKPKQEEPMADRKAVLEVAVAKNKLYLANTGGLGYAEKIKRYEAEIAAIDALAAAKAVVALAEDWSGTFDQALDRFLDALEAKQIAGGVDVMVRGQSSGHAYTRAENIELARSIGVLDELGGDDFFGALVPGANQ